MQSQQMALEDQNRMHASLQERIASQIMQSFSKLNEQIEQMNQKVQFLMDKHEGQFVLAYQNHFKKVKQDLEKLKKKTDEQERQLRNNDRAVFMQKQATIFRQESLKLYERLQQKVQQLQYLKIRARDLQKTNQILLNQMKCAMKSKKIIQTKLSFCQQTIKELQGKLKQKQQQLKGVIQQSNNKNIGSTLPNSTANITYFNPNRLDKMHKASIKIGGIKNNSSFQLKRRSVSFIGLNQDSELKQWFLQCIKTIKKQVANRKKTNMPVNLDHINSIQQFMVVDKLRLLQKFMENQKLLSWMYQKLFPSRVNQLKQYLSHRKEFTQEDQKFGAMQDSNLSIDIAHSQTLLKRQEKNKISIEHVMTTANDQKQKQLISLPKMPSPLSIKMKNSQVRNRLQIRTGRLNLSNL